MRAILLAAGLGTRLLPLTNNLPKCLVEINGRPILDIWIVNLLNSGIKEILVNTHYMADKVESYIKNKSYSESITLTHENKLLGTAGTLLHNSKFTKDDSVMLIHADNLSIFNIEDFQRRHESRPSGCEITMLIFESDNPSSCGIVEIDEKGIVTSFQEKPNQPKSNLANGAVYIVEPTLIQKYRNNDPIPEDFSTQILPYEIGSIYSFKDTKYHRDIGTPESLLKANLDFKLV
jgi:mannose-1-phosphate guanylyltransferase